jgi:hypothetical protein
MERAEVLRERVRHEQRLLERSITEPSGYVLEPLREGPDFKLYRGRKPGNSSPVLVVALAAEQPSPQSLRRLEHEYWRQF